MSASPQKARYEQLLGSTALDWRALAADAWKGPSWANAAREYHEARQDSAGKPRPPDPQLVALLDPKVSLEQAQRRLFEHRRALTNSRTSARACSTSSPKLPGRGRRTKSQR